MRAAAWGTTRREGRRFAFCEGYTLRGVPSSPAASRYWFGRTCDIRRYLQASKNSTYIYPIVIGSRRGISSHTSQRWGRSGDGARLCRWPWDEARSTLPRFSPPAPSPASPQAPPPALPAAPDRTTVPLVCAWLCVRAHVFMQVEY